MVRLTPGHPAQFLATVRGAVYLHDHGRLRPVANVRIEVVEGPNLGKQTTTRADGTYELPGLIPGDLGDSGYQRALTRPGIPPERILPGDNRISVPLEIPPPLSLPLA